MKVLENNSLANNCKGNSFLGINRVRIEMLLGILFALVIADGIVSHYLVAQGFGTEWNPIARLLLDQGGLIIIVKVLGALLALLFLWRIYNKQPRLATVVTVGAVVIYTGVIYWNLLAYLMVSI